MKSRLYLKALEATDSVFPNYTKSLRARIAREIDQVAEDVLRSPNRRARRNVLNKYLKKYGPRGEDEGTKLSTEASVVSRFAAMGKIRTIGKTKAPKMVYLVDEPVPTGVKPHVKFTEPKSNHVKGTPHDQIHGSHSTQRSTKRTSRLH